MGCTNNHSSKKATDRVFLSQFNNYYNNLVCNRRELFKTAFIGRSNYTFGSQYLMEKSIGKGTYGKVFLVKHLKTGEIRCCKIIKLVSQPEGKVEGLHSHLLYGSRFNAIEMQDKSVPLELKILAILDHPNIPKMHEYFLLNGSIYIIMEHVPGMSLRKFLLKEKKLPSEMVLLILNQVFYTLAYLNSNNIVHRDIKPENLMISKSFNGKFHIKLIDFGSASFLPPNQFLTYKAGSLCYAAPEVLKERYTSNCDVWSTGILAIVLLNGAYPLLLQNDKAEKNLMTLTCGKELIDYNINNPELDAIITSILNLNYTVRPNAIEIYKKHFMKECVQIELTDNMLIQQKILNKFIIKCVFHLVVTHTTFLHSYEYSILKLIENFKAADSNAKCQINVGSSILGYSDYIELMMFEEIRKHLKKTIKKMSCQFYFLDYFNKRDYTLEELLCLCKLDSSTCNYILDIEDVHIKISRQDHIDYVAQQLSFYK